MALGYPHPDFLLQILTAKQLDEWSLYEQMEPFGAVELDTQLAQTRRILAETQGGKKKGGGRFTDKDFSLKEMRIEALNRRRRGTIKQSPEEMKSILMGVASTTRRKVTLHQNPPKRKRRKGK